MDVRTRIRADTGDHAPEQEDGNHFVAQNLQRHPKIEIPLP